MAQMELINCHCRNKEGSITLQGLVEAGFDANIVTKTGARKLISCGYMFQDLSERRPVRAPDGYIYMARYMVTAAICLKRIERRSEKEEFYLVDPEPSHLQCDLVLGQNSLIGRDLTENTAAPTEFRHKTDAEKKQQQEEDKKNDEKVQAEQEKIREQKRRQRAANRA